VHSEQDIYKKEKKKLEGICTRNQKEKRQRRNTKKLINGGKTIFLFLLHKYKYQESSMRTHDRVLATDDVNVKNTLIYFPA